MDAVDTAIEVRATSIAEQLPEELISECLRAADFLTRVRASHVSQAWRAAALADPRLWGTFSCRTFRDVDHQDAAFDQLETVLRRSQPLPFQLRIPHRYVGDNAEYASRLATIAYLDVLRLELYNGPPCVFAQLNADQLSLQNLTSLSFLDTADENSYDARCELSPHWGPQCLPNLQSLAGPCLSFRPCQHPFASIRSLTCYLGRHDDWPPTFRLFPGLEHLDLTASWAEYLVGTSREVKLPAGPLPASLKSVVLRCDPSEGACDFFLPLVDWYGERIPRLLLAGAASVQGLLEIFLSGHEHPAQLVMTSTRQEVLFVAGPDREYVWRIQATGCEEEFVLSLGSLLSVRLTSISVAIEQLRAFLLARMTVPGVDELELRLGGGADMPEPLSGLPAALFSFCAPRLRRLILNVDGAEADVRTHLNDVKAVLALLVRSFRTLIGYDAPLLDSITLICPVDIENELDCGDWAWFATEYLVNPEDD